MKVTNHDDYEESDTVPSFRSRPLRIWLDRKTELEIQPGDKLGEVAKFIAMHLNLKFGKARSLAAFYFALGERGEAKKPPGNWTPVELNQNEERVYLKKSA
jgi:hypothetical protein